MQRCFQDSVGTVTTQHGINSSMEVCNLVKEIFYIKLKNPHGLYSSELLCHPSPLKMSICIHVFIFPTLSMIGPPLSIYVSAIFCLQEQNITIPLFY